MLRFVLSVICIIWAGTAAAQNYPERTIRLMVPTAPGGGVDRIARIVAQALQKPLGQSVVVENRPGGGGSVGLTVVAQAAPDGYVFGVAATGHAAINPYVPSKASSQLRELVPVAKLIESPLVIVASPASGIKKLRDIIDRSKSDPKGLSYASSGVYAGPHLAMELLKKATGANLVHVPYRGTAPSVTAVVSNQVPIGCVTFAPARGQIAASRLLPVALPGAKRSKLMPSVPTVSELGVSGFGRGSWIGLFAPKGTPTSIIHRISGEIGQVLRDPAVLKQIAAMSSEPDYENEIAFGKFFAQEVQAWRKILAELPRQKKQ